MAVLGTALNSIGAVFLTHAIYSTHEHTTAFPRAPLPTDITLELLVALLLLTAGIVLASPALKPIQWAQWAGQLSRAGRHATGEFTAEGEAVLSEGDPFAFLGLGGTEGRRGFWDVRGMRREYDGWARGGGK